MRMHWQVVDLLAIAIAEGGELHREFLEKFVERLNAERTLEATVRQQGTFGIFKPPIEKLPEWHEWLVSVAKREVNDYQRALQMREAIHHTHPEFSPYD